MEQVRNTPPEKLTFKIIDKECITCFLNWLQKTRGCGTSTRNVRLAGLHSFFRFLQYKKPENMNRWQDILSIKAKKTIKPGISYLSVDGIKALLEKPDQTTWKGRRDLALLSLMYDCGARVQEIIDLTPQCVRCENPYTIKILGKGNKVRIVPLMDEQYKILKNYMEENKLLKPWMNEAPLFYNNRKEKFTRAGINYILKTYLDMLRLEKKVSVPEKISCHSLRHSKAMHLLQAGVNIVYIRDLLGHESVTTTEIYARADSKQKREALEKAYINVVKEEEARWLINDDLLVWLKNL